MSRWLNDARALELQVRQRAGQPVSPDQQNDDDLKLLAIQGLQQMDPAQGVPLLEKILQGNQSPRLKERALFVLAQSGSPRAQQVLTGIAKGNANPDLQRKAIQYLGMHSIARQPAGAQRDLRVHGGHRHQATGASLVHDGRRQAARARRRHRREVAGAAIGSGPPARHDGRARRAVAALSEGVVRRGPAADAAGHDDGRRCRAPDRSRELRREHGSPPSSREAARHGRRGAFRATRSSTSTTSRPMRA